MLTSKFREAFLRHNRSHQRVVNTLLGGKSTINDPQLAMDDYIASTKYLQQVMAETKAPPAIPAGGPAKPPQKKKAVAGKK